MDYVGYHNYINNNLPQVVVVASSQESNHVQESPHLYGLHPNAEIGFLTATSEKLFKTVFELQPRESGSGGGATSTREEKVTIIIMFFIDTAAAKVKTIVDDISEKMPDQFNMHDIMAKCEERTPYIIVCFQVKYLGLWGLVGQKYEDIKIIIVANI